MSKKALRSERAQKRRQRRQMQQYAIGAIIIVILALLAINLWPEGPEEIVLDPQAQSDAETITTASGLQYQDDVVGDGAEAVVGSAVTVHYTGWLTDGTVFDSSVERGEPATFQLAPGAVIQGWVEGVSGMKVGGIRILTIPPDLAYGPGGNPPTIPPNASLIFRVELLDVQ